MFLVDYEGASESTGKGYARMRGVPAARNKNGLASRAAVLARFLLSGAGRRHYPPTSGETVTLRETRKCSVSSW